MAARRAGVFITSDCAHVSRARTNPDPLLSGQLRVARTFLAAQGFQRSCEARVSRESSGSDELRVGEARDCQEFSGSGGAQDSRESGARGSSGFHDTPRRQARDPRAVRWSGSREHDSRRSVLPMPPCVTFLRGEIPVPGSSATSCAAPRHSCTPPLLYAPARPPAARNPCLPAPSLPTAVRLFPRLRNASMHGV